MIPRKTQNDTFERECVFCLDLEPCPVYKFFTYHRFALTNIKQLNNITRGIRNDLPLSLSQIQEKR